MLNCTLPPIGIILINSYFLNRKAYLDGTMEIREVNWSAILGVALGAVVANTLHWGIASINGMAVATVVFFIGEAVSRCRKTDAAGR